MRKLLKVVLGLAAALVTLAVAAAVAFLVVDGKWLRSAATEQASAASGRTVAINGAMDLDLLSWTPSVTLSDVTFGNPDWATQPEMVKVAELYARIRVMPLFRGRFVVEELRLVRPEIALEQKDGKANWEFGMEGPSAAAVEVVRPTQREDFPVLQHVRIENGTIRYRSQELPEPFVVAIDSLQLSAGGAGDPVNLEASGRYQERPFRLSATSDSFIEFRSAGKPYDLALDARIGETRLSAEGRIGEPVKLEGLDLNLSLEGQSLAELFKVFTLPLPASPSYVMSGRLARNGERWSFEQFEGRLGKTDLRGTFRVDTGGERPRIVADLRSNSFRIEDLEGFWGGDTDARTSPEERAREGILSGDPIDIGKLRRMDAEVSFSGKAIETGALRLRDLSAVLSLDNGLLTLRPLRLGLAEGIVDADLMLDGRESVPTMSGELKVNGLDLGALMAMVGKEDAGAGLLRGHLGLNMRGRSVHDLAASADGEGALIMSGGEIRNILLELMALDLQEAAAQWLSGDKGYVDVGCLAMPITVKDGRFRASPWILDTSDALVVINGYVDLGSETIDLELKPHPKDFSMFNYLTSIDVSGDLAERKAKVEPLEAVGKLVLKTLVAPVMPFLSAEIQKSAKSATPCEGLRQRLEQATAERELPSPEAVPKVPKDPVANPGQVMPAVDRIQIALADRGYRLAVDGVMGPSTRAALRRFQEREGLPATGEPTTETLRRLGLRPAGG